MPSPWLGHSVVHCHWLPQVIPARSRSRHLIRDHRTLVIFICYHSLAPIRIYVSYPLYPFYPFYPSYPLYPLIRVSAYPAIRLSAYPLPWLTESSVVLPRLLAVASSTTATKLNRNDTCNGLTACLPACLLARLLACLPDSLTTPWWHGTTTTTPGIGIATSGRHSSLFSLHLIQHPDPGPYPYPYPYISRTLLIYLLPSPPIHFKISSHWFILVLYKKKKTIFF